MSTAVIKTGTAWKGKGRKNHQGNNSRSVSKDWKGRLTETEKMRERNAYREKNGGGKGRDITRGGKGSMCHQKKVIKLSILLCWYLSPSIGWHGKYFQTRMELSRFPKNIRTYLQVIRPPRMLSAFMRMGQMHRISSTKGSIFLLVYFSVHIQYIR